jgi:hypothetical protein
MIAAKAFPALADEATARDLANKIVPDYLLEVLRDPPEGAPSADGQWRAS